MTFCHNCAHNLDLGTEKFCPKCGTDLEQKTRSIDISTKGDVFGTGFIGSGNVIGKEVDYTVQGNVLNLQISGNLSSEVLDTLQRIMAVPIQVEQASMITEGTVSTKEDIKKRMQESEGAHKQIKSVLEEITEIEKNTQSKIQEIKAGDLQISTKELTLKEIILKGKKYSYEKEYDRAIEYFDESIKLDPQDANAWSNKGLALHGLGKFVEAIQCYDQAIKLDPQDANAWSNKGLALNNMGKCNDAIKYFERSLRVDPNYALAWYNKGWALGELGKYKEAIKCHDKSIDLNPNYALAWNNKGWNLSQLKRYNEAIKYLDKAIELDSNCVFAWYNKGLALFYLREYREAIECFDRLLEIDPNHDLALNIKTTCLNLLNEKEMKKRWFR